MSDILNIIWIILLIQIFIPLFQKRFLAAKRLGIMRNIEKKRQSRVITTIHRQETMSLLGFPVVRYIDIEDSEHLLRAIRMTPEEIYQLMERYPQAKQQRPEVEFIPVPYRSPGAPGKGEK